MDIRGTYIVYLQCATNNRADTMFDAFLRATQACGVSSRVRSDHGGENVDVCFFMISTRGAGRGSHISGSSHHNQRIERLWRDRCVASTFHCIFTFMESSAILDPDKELDIFVLHCVYLSKIYQHLQLFVDAWNNHPVRSERNWSPRRLWLNGMLYPQRQSLTAVRDSTPVEDFGIDYYGPLPAYAECDVIDLPGISVPLSADELQRYVSTVDHMTTNNFWVDVFIQARQILFSMMQKSTNGSE